MGTRGLPEDWAFRPAFDLELKQYTLLAYLQRVRARFTEHKLYPHLHELEGHHAALLRLRTIKEELARNIGGEVLGFDPATGMALHAPVEQPEPLDVIDAVIDFALPGLRRTLEHGSDLRQELAAHIRSTPVGILPLYTSEGWLMLRTGREARVYRYAMPVLREHAAQRQYRSVVTRYVDSYTVSISHTYENIRAELIARSGDLPVPAVFVFEAEAAMPHIETFLPLAKQLMFERIAPRS
jgi:hypothetical protein